MNTQELETKCNQVIDILSDCNIAEKYTVLKRLSESFIDVCHSEGIKIKEFHYEKRVKEAGK